jgi:hypothetical protein
MEVKSCFFELFIIFLINVDSTVNWKVIFLCSTFVVASWCKDTWLHLHQYIFLTEDVTEPAPIIIIIIIIII